MSKSKTFSGITSAIWECIKATSIQYNTVYTPEGANRGTATNNTPIGKVTLAYDYDPVAQTATYVISQKPFIVSDDQIWGFVQKAVDKCSGKPE